jgi:nicotinamidase-related amidase
MPAPLLSDLINPATTALVTQECQGGVIGPNANLPQLAEEASRVAVPNIGRLLTAARAVDASVIHCLVERRTDGKGSNRNARLFKAAVSLGWDLHPGGEGAALIPEFGPEPSDLVLIRRHGVGPMAGTDLDSMLRNLGITTIIGVGVSVNIAITNFVMDAVNASYQFVLARDAVAGIPTEYADSVIDNSLSLLATITTTDEILEAWKA